MATAGVAKSKLVNGQRINIATGAVMKSSVDSDQSDLKRTASNPTGRTVTMANGTTLNEADSLAYGKNDAKTTEILKTNNIAAPLQPVAPATPTAAPVAPATQTPALTAQQGATGVIPPPAPTPPSPIQQGLAAAQASGTPPPTSAGAAKAAVQTYLPPPTPAPTIADTMIAEDPFFAQIQKTWQEFMSPQNQKQTLVQEYNSLLKSSGIQELDEEILNAKNVIEGTEDDIRTEITKAGGFATDSQVMAMTNARNKSLIKNYSNLVATRDSKNEYLKTMMSLSAQDRQQADQQFDRAMNFTFQVADYKMKMKENAQKSYDRTIAAVGYDGLYQSTGGDPYTTSLIERTMGLPTGGLQIAAQRATQERQMALEKEKLGLDVLRSNLATDVLQRESIRASTANSYDSIRSRKEADARAKSGTLSGKPQTAAQASANGYADRTVEANKIISQLGGKFTSKGSLITSSGFFPNFFKSEDRQKYEQAQRNFVNAVLRRESGAAISPTEFESAAQQYFPQPGDKQGVLEQKEQNRTTVISNLYREANVAPPVGVGSIIEYEGQSYRVDENGELTEL